MNFTISIHHFRRIAKQVKDLFGNILNSVRYILSLISAQKFKFLRATATPIVGKTGEWGESPPPQRDRDRPEGEERRDPPQIIFDDGSPDDTQDPSNPPSAGGKEKGVLGKLGDAILSVLSKLKNAIRLPTHILDIIALGLLLGCGGWLMLKYLRHLLYQHWDSYARYMPDWVLDLYWDYLAPHKYNSIRREYETWRCQQKPHYMPPRTFPHPHAVPQPKIWKMPKWPVRLPPWPKYPRGQRRTYCFVFNEILLESLITTFTVFPLHTGDLLCAIPISTIPTLITTVFAPTLQLL